ncbi:hypothetical protein L6164_005032 [Bauhinia variegata]|uniref:Uncharacterized protein n=1 Tax=Bauhinia variegata TaxID=167791 RepID=A0ACB9PQ11_BAUVA|nr:hypothetical protein L6164_005032 [Bauhinia variegata]
MASLSCSTTILVLLLTIFSCLQHFSVCSFEFRVGSSKGWLVPSANDTNIYNDWASHNRFQVGDSIRFKYKKDSVMEVTQEDYNKCNSTHPNFFSNTGSTVFRLEHPGSFYFISGASGHCEKGQRMIVRVMYPDDDSHSLPQHPKSSAFHAHAAISLSKLLSLNFVLAYLVSCVI